MASQNELAGVSKNSLPLGAGKQEQEEKTRKVEKWRVKEEENQVEECTGLGTRREEAMG